MMVVITIFCFILGVILIFVAAESNNDEVGYTAIGFLVLGVILLIIGFLHGFINYPPTEGSHIGIITAIDLEGVYFRRYEVYLKSDGFGTSSNGELSNETTYLLYDYEKELVEQLKEYMGKKVKIIYGHDGGYIGWKSCGTYHIKSIELLEE